MALGDSGSSEAQDVNEVVLTLLLSSCYSGIDNSISGYARRLIKRTGRYGSKKVCPVGGEISMGHVAAVGRFTIHCYACGEYLNC